MEENSLYISLEYWFSGNYTGRIEHFKSTQFTINGNLNALKLEIENGVPKYVYEWLVLEASEYEHLHILKYLHGIGCDLNINNSASMILASMNNNFDVIKYLCENGVKFTNQCFKLVCEHGVLENICYLCDKYVVNINLAIDTKTANLLMNNKKYDVIEYLLENNLSIDKITATTDFIEHLHQKNKFFIGVATFKK